jgi:hypothetical protein
VNAVMDIPVSLNEGNFATGYGTVSLSGRTCCMELVVSLVGGSLQYRY